MSSQPDHRALGKQLDLFAFSPLVGSGLPLFTPRGTIIREELAKFIRSLQEPKGYQHVSIPHLAKPDLYKTSGHWDKFKDDIFHVRGKNKTAFVLKPMNCPHHTQIYASRPRSYRDLPMRLAEITHMYRDEQPGELLGLSRVRAITIDDAHVFCRPEQIEMEIDTILTLIDRFYEVFDLPLSFSLSLRDPKEPDKYLGDESVWQQAEGALRDVLKKKRVDFTEVEGEAAFYGPKIDFVATDSLKRQWQLATVQLDLNMPGRFGLTYIDEAGKAQTPVMIHRAIAGALERFMAILLEHYNGALPMWLSPTQVAVLPIADDQVEHAQHTARDLAAAGIRAEVDDRTESIAKKIRDAQLMKVPAMLVIGKKEISKGVVAVRTREEGDKGTATLEEIRKEFLEQIANKN